MQKDMNSIFRLSDSNAGRAIGAGGFRAPPQLGLQAGPRKCNASGFLIACCQAILQ